MTTRLAAAFLGTLVLAGCAGLPAVAPDPNPAVALPERWQATLPHAGGLAELSRWWAQFDDPMLSRSSSPAPRSRCRR